MTTDLADKDCTIPNITVHNRTVRQGKNRLCCLKKTLFYWHYLGKCAEQYGFLKEKI